MTTWVLRLLIANIAVYLIAQPGSPQFGALMLVPSLLLARPWTLVTYMFLHGGVMHLLFNMLGLYFFGPRLETRIGSRDFILMYLAAGITGALVSFITPHAAIVGASGAIFGVLLGFARFWPHERIFIYGILPVPARVLVIVFTAISLLSGFSGAGSGVAHFTHLGGFLGAWIYLSVRERRPKRFQRQATPGAAPSALERLSGKATRDEQRWESIRLENMHEINRSEVERLRAKIAAHGTRSLTPSERDFLNRMAGPSES